VWGIDSDAAAIAAAVHNARARNLTGIEFIAQPAAVGCDPCPRAPAGAHGADRGSATRGLETAVLKQVVRIKPFHVIYVSCAPDTMARDAAALLKAGYRATQSQLFDMFRARRTSSRSPSLSGRAGRRRAGTMRAAAGRAREDGPWRSRATTAVRRLRRRPAARPFSCAG